MDSRGNNGIGGFPRIIPVKGVKIGSHKLKAAAERLGGYIDFKLAPTVFSYAERLPPGCVMPREGEWTCAFAMMRDVQAGAAAAFSRERPGCIGAAFYFGFKSLPMEASAFFLSRKERLKQDSRLAAAFYREVQPVETPTEYLLFQKLDAVEEENGVEVINLWVDAASLSRLHVLANFDRTGNDNVTMPFASGCQSIWTLPLKEKSNDIQRAVMGSLDPTVRKFLPENATSFSITAERFLEICDNIEGSYLGD